jgi:hypothetical protein
MPHRQPDKTRQRKPARGIGQNVGLVGVSVRCIRMDFRIRCHPCRTSGEFCAWFPNQRAHRRPLLKAAAISWPSRGTSCTFDSQTGCAQMPAVIHCDDVLSVAATFFPRKRRPFRMPADRRAMISSMLRKRKHYECAIGNRVQKGLRPDPVAASARHSPIQPSPLVHSAST